MVTDEDCAIAAGNRRKGDLCCDRTLSVGFTVETFITHVVLAAVGVECAAV